MLLAAYMKRQLEALAKFEAEWLQENRKDPENYPLTMPNEAEWDEQVRAWRSLQESRP